MEGSRGAMRRWRMGGSWWGNNRWIMKKGRVVVEKWSYQSHPCELCCREVRVLEMEPRSAWMVRDKEKWVQKKKKQEGWQATSNSAGWDDNHHLYPLANSCSQLITDHYKALGCCLSNLLCMPVSVVFIELPWENHFPFYFPGIQKKRTSLFIYKE